MKQLDATDLYREHGARIYRFCLRLSGNRTDAEDLTAETLNVLVESASQFDGRSSLETYLYRVARNRWRMHIRRERVRRLFVQVAEPSGPAVDVDQIALGMAIDRLSPKLKEAFLLVRAEGLTHRETAEILRVPIGTVQARVFAATKAVRDSLNEPDPQLIPEDGALKEVRP